MPIEGTDKAGTPVLITDKSGGPVLVSEVISKPGAALEVKIVVIPAAVKEGITLALREGKKAAAKHN